jgi:hypothetical protein
MRKPGQADTLVKIASLGGGGVAIGGNLQKTADRDKKIKEEIKKAKMDDAEYDEKIRKIKMKYALDKKVSEKKIEKSKK